MNIIDELVIGSQIWSTDNLDATTFRNGDIIPQITDPDEWEKCTTGAWCWYENNPGHGEVYGRLYNWYAVNDARGLAPDGWKIPSHFDWLKMRETLVSRGFGGQILKDPSSWEEEQTPVSEVVRGFNALPGGYRDPAGRFSYMGEACGWWTSRDENSSANPFWSNAHFLMKDDDHISWKPFMRNTGFYVRCIRKKEAEIVILVDDDFSCSVKSITLKFNESTSLQDVLESVYNRVLVGIVTKHSYGREWMLHKFDGTMMERILKDKSGDSRSLFSMNLNNSSLIVTRCNQ